MTDDRQQLYKNIIEEQRRSRTGRLATKDTFDLYKTFVAMAEADESSGLQKPHEIRIDQQVDEQHLLDLQLTASRQVYFISRYSVDNIVLFSVIFRACGFVLVNQKKIIHQSDQSTPTKHDGRAVLFAVAEPFVYLDASSLASYCKRRTSVDVTETN